MMTRMHLPGAQNSQVGDCNFAELHLPATSIARSNQANI